MKPVTVVRLLPILAALAATPPGLCGQDAARRAAESIAPELVARDISRLAADSMMGRWTPSPELEKSARYIAAEFQRIGLRPGGDSGTYMQRYPIDAIELLQDSAAVWVTGSRPARFTSGVDFAFSFNNWSDWNVEGPAVVLRGKLDGRPAFDTTAMRGRVLLLPAGWGNSYERLSAWGPAAIIWLANRPDSIFGRIVRGQARPTRIVRGRPSSPDLVMSYRAATPLLELGGLDTPTLLRPMTDSTLTMTSLGDAVVHVRFRIRHLPHTEPANVVGILEGSDPTLRNEYVVYTAHYDHLGVRDPVNGDSIYNGADDNASGTAAVMAVARAFAALGTRPRRSVIFALVSGEEFLGEGSRFFVAHPPVPASMIVADLNADMVGRNWNDTVVVVGRKDSDLGAMVDRVTGAHPELAMTPVDSSTRPNEADLYFWSDQAAFIQQRIPFLYFYSGLHPDYHRPSDSAEKIDAGKVARIARLMFYTGLAAANADQRPRWIPGRYERIVGRD
jgi:hypothetical protein